MGKKAKIKKLNLSRVAIYSGIITGVVTFFVTTACLLFYGFKNGLLNSTLGMSGFGYWEIVLLPVFGFFAGYLFGLLASFLFNLLARISGGLEIEISENHKKL
jgi:hypothetical protein